MATLHFVFHPAEDDNADPVYDLFDGIDSAEISIHDSRRYGGCFGVIKYFYEDGKLAGGEMISDHWSLEAAKTAAFALYHNIK